MAETPIKAVEPMRRKYSGCSNIKEYENGRKLGEGTFGEVYQAKRRKTGEIVALKKILMHNEKEGFPITALREIKLLKTLDHLNVIRLEEMAVERSGELKKKTILYMVTPYMEHDLSGMLDNPEIHVSEPMRKSYMQQLLRGLNYLHQNHILHRDMKAANLLISNSGILKIADFGLARHYEGPVPQAGSGGGEATRDYTSLVVTRWYRPPELLLQLRRYTPAIDLWGAGCVFGEMYKRKPILTGQSDMHQTQLIFELLGSPTSQSMPGWDTLPGAGPVAQMEKSLGNIDKAFKELDYQALSLLKDLLKLDWRSRINAMDALEHPYFTTAPLPARPEDIPRFKDSHELDRRNNRPSKQALPPAPPGGAVGGGAPNSNWEGERNNNEPPPPYVDRYVPDNGSRLGNGQSQPSSRVPAAVYGRDRPSNGSRGPDRDLNSSRVPAAARRPPGTDNDGSRPVSHLPPPPGEGRHALPMNPLRSAKDTYIPGQQDRVRRDDRDLPRRDDRASSNRDDRDGPRRNDAPRRDDRDSRRRDDRYSRTPDKERRNDRHIGSSDRRPREEYRDPDAPRDDRDRPRVDRGDDRRDHSRRDRSRERSPPRERVRDRDRDGGRERNRDRAYQDR